MKFNPKLLGERINEQRRKMDISQEELAELIGKSVPMISYYGSGKRVPPPDILFKLSEIFKVSADYLLGLTDSVHGDIPAELKEKLSRLEDIEEQNQELKSILALISDSLKRMDVSTEKR